MRKPKLEAPEEEHMMRRRVAASAYKNDCCSSHGAIICSSIRPNSAGQHEVVRTAVLLTVPTASSSHSQTAMESGVLPDASAALNQAGLRPRPDQVISAFSG